LNRRGKKYENWWVRWLQRYMWCLGYRAGIIFEKSVAFQKDSEKWRKIENCLIKLARLEYPVAWLAFFV
jgi:hypothetical protein